MELWCRAARFGKYNYHYVFHSKVQRSQKESGERKMRKERREREEQENCAIKSMCLKRKIRDRFVVRLTIFSDFLDRYSLFHSSPRIVAITGKLESNAVNQTKGR